MAEADMELDMAPQIASGEPIDEDLIDYDDDDLARGDGYADHDMSMYLDKLNNGDDHEGQYVDGMEILDYQEHDTIITDSDHDGVKDPLATAPHPPEPYALDGQHETPEIDIPDRVEPDDGEPHEQVDGDSSLIEVQPVTVKNDTTEEISYEEDPVEPTADANYGASDTQAHEGGESKKITDETEYQPEDDEITWEDEPQGDEDNQNSATYEDERVNDDTTTAGPDTINNIRQIEEDQTAEQQKVPGSQTTEQRVKERTDQSAELQNQGSSELLEEADQDQSIEKAGDQSHYSNDSPATTSQDLDDTSAYPDITVHYRGENYPLFSATGDGFFSSLSVLDCSFQELLANFRVELDQETQASDDLVLQIDELGLEISEAHQNDDFSTCTLRQVLEIHELLVKNQDPEGTRCLFVYLTARPNPSKRYEYLVECATEGKGIDEIIHLFASSEGVQRSRPPTGGATDDEGTPEPTDDPEPDARDEEEAATNPQADTTSHGEVEQHQAEDSHHKEESYEEPGEAEDVAKLSDVGLEATGDADIVYSNKAEAGKDIVDEPLLESPGEGNLEKSKEVDAGEVEDDKEDEVDFGIGSDTLDHNPTAEVSKETQVLGDADPDANPDFINENTSEALAGEELDDEEAEVQDSGAGEAIDVVDFAPQTTESSNSHTLHESSEVDATSPMSNGAGEDDVGGEDLAEIDWRDEPGVVEVVASAPSTGEKRGREDEGVKADIDQDVKRRRP